MSFSVWARVARTCFIRPRITSGPFIGRSYVLLAAKPVRNVLLRPIPLATRQQSSVATLEVQETDTKAQETDTEAQETDAKAQETDAKAQATGKSLPEPAEATENENQPPQFSSLQNELHPGIYRALTQSPFQLKTMSPVQAAVLPLIPQLKEPHDPDNPSSRDLMVKAKTGTGKTLGFLIPAVEARLQTLQRSRKGGKDDSGRFGGDRFASSHAGILIISPTRELATQIANEAVKLVQHLKDIQVHLFVGGENRRRQLREFHYGRADIIVATPGRMNDLLESSEQVSGSIAHTQTFILDEADTLLDMGFMPDITNLLKYLPPSPERQTFLFSATLSPAIRKIASESLSSNYKYINCVSDDAPPTHAHIPQYHTVLPSAQDQFSHILRLLAHDQLTNPKKSKAIVFLPTTKFTALFADFLRVARKDTLPAGNHTSVYELHSQKSQDSRTRASNAFRGDKLGASVLVTSDVSARGVDYPGVTRVIQVGIPKSGEVYVHRVGRTGRAGTQGRGDLVILPFERKFLSTQMKRLPLKPLTVEEHTSQLLEIAKKHDEDPKDFWGGEIPVVKKPRSTIRNPTVSKSTFFPAETIVPLLEDIPRAVSDLVSGGEPQEYDDTFASLLGYYVGLSEELDLYKSEVLEACQKWAEMAFGIPKPYVSTTMREKLGLMGEQKRLEQQERRREQRTMNDVRKGGFKSPSKSPWMGRGNRRSREARERNDSQSFDSGYRRNSDDGYRRNSDDGYRRNSDNGYRRNSDDGYRGNSDDGSRFGGERGRFGGERRNKTFHGRRDD